MGTVVRLINNNIAELEESGPEDARIKSKKLSRKITSSNRSFIMDRYHYDFNNAYYIRNRSYTKYYFLLKDLLQKTGSIPAFLKEVTALPKSEEDAVKQIEAIIAAK